MAQSDDQGMMYGLVDDAPESVDDLLSERVMRWDDFCFTGRDERRCYVEEVFELVLGGEATPRQRYLAEQVLSYCADSGYGAAPDPGYDGLRVSGCVLARLGVFDGADAVCGGSEGPVLGYDRLVDSLSDRLASWGGLSLEE